MIVKYTHPHKNYCLSAYIKKCIGQKHNSIKTLGDIKVMCTPKPYEELLKLFDIESSGRLRTPWGTMPEMQKILISKDTYEVSINLGYICNLMELYPKEQEITGFQCTLKGLAYPAHAFNVVPLIGKTTESTLHILNE